MDCEHENEEEKDIKREQKGLLVILASLIVISVLVVVGVFIFFPFDSHSRPSVIIEKNLPNQGKENILEENRFLSNLAQNDEPSFDQGTKGTSAEEFFIEILPEEEKERPASLTQPITISPPVIAERDKKDSKEASQSKEAQKGPAIKKAKTNTGNVNKETKIKRQEKNESPSRPKAPSFWIQLGSYSDEKLADNVIIKIKQEGFEALKLKFNDGTRTLFRVRMGPYADKKEANKFLNWVQELPNFKKSYILQTNT